MEALSLKGKEPSQTLRGRGPVVYLVYSVLYSTVQFSVQRTWIRGGR